MTSPTPREPFVVLPFLRFDALSPPSQQQHRERAQLALRVWASHPHSISQPNYQRTGMPRARHPEPMKMIARVGCESGPFTIDVTNRRSQASYFQSSPRKWSRRRGSSEQGGVAGVEPGNPPERRLRDCLRRTRNALVSTRPRWPPCDRALPGPNNLVRTVLRFLLFLRQQAVGPAARRQRHKLAHAGRGRGGASTLGASPCPSGPRPSPGASDGLFSSAGAGGKRRFVAPDPTAGPRLNPLIHQPFAQSPTDPRVPFGTAGLVPQAETGSDPGPTGLVVAGRLRGPFLLLASSRGHRALEAR